MTSVAMSAAAVPGGGKFRDHDIFVERPTARPNTTGVAAGK